MKEKVLFLVCLLIGGTLGGGFAELSIANPGVANSKTEAEDVSVPAADLSRNWVENPVTSATLTHIAL